MNGSLDSSGFDTSHDSRRLQRADSNHSVNSTMSVDSRDHKIPRTSKNCMLSSLFLLPEYSKLKWNIETSKDPDQPMPIHSVITILPVCPIVIQHPGSLWLNDC